MSDGSQQETPLLVPPEEGDGPDLGLVDGLVVEAAGRLFAGTCSFEVVQAAEDEGWAPGVWEAVASAGFAWVGVPETAGGSGGTLADACAVLRAAGAHGAPVPLAETGILGGWLLAEVGVPLPAGPVTVWPGRVEDSVVARVVAGGGVVLSGAVHRVPWAGVAELVVGLVGADDGSCRVVAVPAGEAVVEGAVNLAGEPRDRVVFDGVVVPAARAVAVPSPLTADRLRLRGALSRVMLMAGALEAMSRLTVAYTGGRHQFGRPVARFQAVQQHLVWGAQDAALVGMAAEVAARDASRDLEGSVFQVAAAKAVADECAATATRWAHQAHGAMGMTREYRLHQLSRRLWSWRREYATPGEWAMRVGRLAETAGPDGLYPLIGS